MSEEIVQARLDNSDRFPEAMIRERPSILTERRVHYSGINLDIESPVMDRIIQGKAESRKFIGRVSSIVTLPDRALVRIVGWVEGLSSLTEAVDEPYLWALAGDLEARLLLPFPPNEQSFLDELKCFRTFERGTVALQGIFFMGATTKKPLLQHIEIMDANAGYSWLPIPEEE